MSPSTTPAAVEAPVEGRAGVLGVRIEPRGPAAEQGVARLCATTDAVRDLTAPLGAPAADATCADGGAVIDLLVEAAVMSLGDADLHITVQRD